MSDEAVRKSLGDATPLSEAETVQLSEELRRLAETGELLSDSLLKQNLNIPVLLRRKPIVAAIPKALELLGADRDNVVVGVLEQFARAVQEHREDMQRRSALRDYKANHELQSRYFGTVFLLEALKPLTESGVTEVSKYLYFDLDEVRDSAATMLTGVAYSKDVVGAIFEQCAKHGIRRWPNPYAKALVSVSEIPEVMSRLISSLKSEEKNLRHLAILSFRYMGGMAPEEARTLMYEMAEEGEEEFQNVAIRALETIHAQDFRLRRVGLIAIKSEKYWVRHAAIHALASFDDPETRMALIAQLTDEGGPDCDNDMASAKALAELSLQPDEFPAVRNALELIVEKQDEFHAKFDTPEFLEGISEFVELFKEQVKGEPGWSVSEVEKAPEPEYFLPEILPAVASLLPRFGMRSKEAIPLLRNALARPFISRTRDREKLDNILSQLEATE